MENYKLKCFNCGTLHTEEESSTECLKCGGPIETYFDYEKIKPRLNFYNLKNTPISALKYLPFYPVKDFNNIVSLGEGGTPLIKANKLGEKIGLKNLYIKNEGANPTGCFKDRGTMVEVAKAKELGAKAICLASTGNMAASVSAYASASNIDCYVLVPEGTALGKLAQTMIFGAKVIQIRSTFSDCAILASKMAKKFGYYLAGDYTFRTEGQKSQGYEIIEQLFWKAPDYIVCPIGCGTNFHAIAKGVKEFYDFGLIDKMPKLIGVQASGANPIVRSFEKGRKDFDPLNKVDTLAGAIAVANPLDGNKILADIFETNGFAVDIDDDFLLQSQQEQAKLEGIFSEPAGAVAYAGVKKLQEEGFFKENDVIVCIATGTGLKDPKSPLKILPEPSSLEPKFEEIEKFIEGKLYDIRNSGVREKEKIIFSFSNKEKLDSNKIKETIKSEFGIEILENTSNEIIGEIESFLSKGKEIKKTDLQYILEETLDKVYLKNRILEIVDFEIFTSLKNQPKAKIKLNAFGKNISGEGVGVGPVDAGIQAILNGISQDDELKIKLIDYEVAIDSNGVDASVGVKMTLLDKNNNKVISKTTSPDIIVASLKAFEKGFNLLYFK